MHLIHVNPPCVRVEINFAEDGMTLSFLHIKYDFFSLHTIVKCVRQII